MDARDHILIEGARQNNLRGLDLRLPLGELIVVTGVSGSGKSSLAFDTIYAEGQRRYVETFSPYARQFLERMDKPRADRVEGIPPAIAIDQTNPVRTSRSTVGTMTEMNDHLKLLFARAARLHCRGCGRAVRRDTPGSIYEALLEEGWPARETASTSSARETPVLITFPVRVPRNFTEEEVLGYLAAQGYGRIHAREGDRLEVIQDRVPLDPRRKSRIVEGIEAALQHGRGQVTIRPAASPAGPLTPRRFSSDLHCPDCDIHYADPVPNTFSFNSPLGACETCRGFGRTMGIDYALVVPDESKTLAEGAVKPWQTESYRECQDDLMRFARRRGVPTDIPWRRLAAAQRRWVLEGEGPWDEKVWYGVKRFFDWLETKSYRMHIRVLLSKYRAYNPCPDCRGARLKPAALLWRLGDALAEEGGLPGLTIHDVMLQPLERCHGFFAGLRLPAPLDEATGMLLSEIRGRLRYLVDVGLGYLTLDRQSRTLSGGEVQRINLTTALGTSLVNTLFVLDEPSVGLHARDMTRVIEVLRRLRDAGNSLLVVEHDPQVMMAADRILDLGPGPGERGGRVVFFGRPRDLLDAEGSLTGAYLSGRKRVLPAAGRAGLPSGDPALALEVVGAAEHNLKDIGVKIPLNRLVCVTGVSGSGKSTLVEDVLYNALRKLKGRPANPPGRHVRIRGGSLIADAVMVDQSPIGRSARSNPASYVGALDAVRKSFALEPLARERSYTAGTFSFNSGHGRCPACGGSGFEHVEMQFLSDVYLRCPDCDGRRFRPEVLEVKLRPAGGRGPGLSIADLLDLTVTEAAEFLAGNPEALRGLEPLREVGLGYLKLGQPTPTLSGGEAQRLKLAGHLARSRSGRDGGRGTLFLFDEPTTGLHFEDIHTLLLAFRRLLAEGHSLVVIEHNLDVIRSADWIIDLGPEGGDAGGRIVCAGTPVDVAACAPSHTGAALRALGQAGQAGQATPGGVDAVAEAAPEAGAAGAIRIRNAREHNLKGIDLSIPRDQFTVITGVSGSGKSTVAFDILFAEGQRRYLESLNAYARQFVEPVARPDVDAILGIPPTVAIEQRTSRGGRKSTVATQTEIYHFLRLLFVKLGTQHCPDCAIVIEPQTREAILARILRNYRGRSVALLAPLIVARKGYYTDLAVWAAGKGFTHLRVDGDLLPTAKWPRLDRYKEHGIELPVGEVEVTPRSEGALRDLLDRALDYGRGTVLVAAARHPAVLFSTRRACPRCARSFEELDPRLFSFNSKHGWCGRCYGTGLSLLGFDADQTGEEIWWNDWWEGEAPACPDCQGRRLRPEALAVRFEGRTIAEMTAMPVEAAEKYFRTLKPRGRAALVARDILAELRSRLAFLAQVGLPYLSLDRAAPTLSGGEAQRIRLASQLGSNLRGVCYVLDEPTIGLHARDNRMLLDTLERLKRKGNTVVVVEHDEETIRRADHVIDLGPGGGLNGGRVIAEGTVEDLLRNPDSVTGRCLADPLRHPLEDRPGTATPSSSGSRGVTPSLELVDARLHNLKRLQVEIPLGKLVCVTGVSGSGKSTLVREVLHDNLRRILGARRRRGGGARRGLKPPHRKAASLKLRGCSAIRGADAVARVLEVDQAPIGRTPRSCPATYVGFWDAVRRLFASTPEARMRGYGPGRFSFNVKGGRCETCEGQGMKTIELSFLPDVKVACESCGSSRFNPETASVLFKEKSIGDVLAMSVDEAVEFFDSQPAVRHPLRLLQEVGLGYLTLGQQSPTLSGGEAQRIKLVTELAKAGPADTPPPSFTAPHTLYVLDEPTVGLHMADVLRLIRVLHRLVAAGNTVVVIEHNLDIIAEAGWVIDLGPEGGDGGGRVVAQGTPATVARVRPASHTARVLATFLKERGPRTGGRNTSGGRRRPVPSSARRSAAVQPRI